MKNKQMSITCMAFAISALFYNSYAVAQGIVDRAWPKDPSLMHRFFHSPSDPVARKGYIVLKKGDTLKGHIRIPTYNDYMKPLKTIQFLALDKSKFSDIIEVQLTNVNYISTETSNMARRAYFIPFRNSLWMILAKKDRASILYQRWWQTENDGSITKWDQMMLALDTGSVDIPLYNKLGIIARTQMILQFVNKRYKTHFAASDFKDENAMINYILNKENGL